MERVPRYTSYPTAPHFHEGFTSDIYKTELETLKPSDPLSLYFHIPFCKQLCWFCGCHTKITNNDAPVRQYLTTLAKEIDLTNKHLKPKKVQHIHFGGGSPTIIQAPDFTAFMAQLQSKYQFRNDIEIAVEIDPRSIDDEKVKAYAKAGVNRASLGVQDFNLQVQFAINRIQSFEMVQNVIEKLRLENINNINLDLIYGLPLQTQSSIKDTIEKTITLSPNRISLFGYAHVPWMKQHQKLIAQQHLPDKQMRLDMFELASKQLQKEGYIPIGLDHFVHPEDDLATTAQTQTLHRNFQGYTNDSCQALLGFGVSSISTLPHAYAQNTQDYRAYTQAILDGQLPTAKGIHLSKQDTERRTIIMSLMCNLKVALPEGKFKPELEKLEPYIKNKDVTYQDGHLTINPKARHNLRLIAATFDHYLAENQARYSQAV